MIIGACGFGSTGSSVVTDYLKEFDSVVVKDDLEFTYVNNLDGLLYLERAIMSPFNRTIDSIYAIKRFEEMVERTKRAYQKHGLSAHNFELSAKKFIDSITMTSWYWNDLTISYRYRSKYFLQNYMLRNFIPEKEKREGVRYTGWPLTKVRLSICPDNFYDAARVHMDELLSAMGLDQNKVIALDQPFSGNNPQACFPFFKDPYAIVVDRDPRDLYVFGKTKLMGKMRFFPIDQVDDFIVYYRSLRKGQPYEQSNPRILRLKFEDMVYEYDSTTAILKTFLRLPENPRPKSIFDPSLSVANTQVFKRFPQYNEDIRKIEEELPEYLFDYSKYPVPDFTKQMFSGKSPLHERFSKVNAESGYIPRSK